VISFPKTIASAQAAHGVVRAGGTDLQERRLQGITTGDLVDLRDTAGLDRLELDELGLHLGAGLTVQTLATEPRILEGFPGLAQAAAGLATPQIRARGTLGGNVLQEVRCWYYRSPRQVCAKKGGAVCLSRQGDHLYHSCFDLGLCAAPHPSTLALALLVYEAEAELSSGSRLEIPALLGDGHDPRQTHALPPGELLVALHLPPAVPGESAAYGRATSRAQAEWPLVEVIVRLWIDLGKGRHPVAKITDAQVAMGGVANRPLHLPLVEAALIGAEPTDEVLATAAARAAEGASPLPMTAYKVKLIPGIVRDVLTRARDAVLPPVVELPAATPGATPAPPTKELR